MTRHRGLVGLAALLAATILAGCGGTNPSVGPSDGSPGSPTAGASAAPSALASAAATPAPTTASLNCADVSASATFAPKPISQDDPSARLLASVEGAVQQIRGLTADREVPRYTVDQTSVCAYLRGQLSSSMPPELVAATEHFYKLLDLMPADASLQAITLNLLTSQVAGFYDITTKAMYVVSSSGTIGPLEQFIYAHEYDHALQDQAFDLTKIRGTATDRSDFSLARQALIEGDATLLMSLWAQQNLTPAQLLQVAGGADPASQAALDAAPPIVKEPLLWPYTQGLSLTLSAYQTSASFAGVDALWKNPPDTTEQLIHPDKLASREPAVPVAFPGDFAKRLGAGWTVTMQDTLGELGLNIVMRSGDAGAGSDPAAGWGGDRVALVDGPSGASAAVVDSAWDTAAAASSAAAQLDQLAAKLKADGKHAAVLTPSPKRVVLISADSDATLGAVANVLGLAG